MKQTCYLEKVVEEMKGFQMIYALFLTSKILLVLI
jgi:hypothetical protein